MGGPPKVPLPPQPPACANCVTSVQATGAAPVQTAFSMVRASNGQSRIDMPNTSVITDPIAQHAIVLDHINKRAQILPLKQQAPGMPLPQMPQAPGVPVPGMPQQPQVAVENLGKSVIEGHPVEGVRYIVQPPPQPQMPQAPQVPQAPKPPLPGMPAPPTMPPPPTISEVWTSTQLKVPVLTKITTPGGVQTTYCKPAPAAEPNPATFQIPPGYRLSGK
jgi:hypothetical protein